MYIHVPNIEGVTQKGKKDLQKLTPFIVTA